MKHFLLRRFVPLLLVFLLLGGLLRLSENSLMAAQVFEEKPYYVPEDAPVAELGGLGLSYAEFRYQAWQALTQDLGRSYGEVDLFYDETLAEQVKELALLRAARWRAVALLAMEEDLEVPEPDSGVVETLCREAFVTPTVAKALLRAESLSSLVFLRRYGPEGSLLGEREITAWGEESGVIRLRALWLSANPEIYTETEIRGRLEQAESFARQLRRGEAEFDDLCAAYGADERWAAGKQLASGGLSDALYAAGSALSMGDCAVLQLEDGVYLLLRCPLEPEASVYTGDGQESLRSLAARGLYLRELGERAGGLARRFTAEWKKIRMDLLFRQGN